MGRKALYEDPTRRALLLSGLRAGLSRQDAIRQVLDPDGRPLSLVTLLGWIDRDPVLAHEVEAAEALARGSGVAASPRPGVVPRKVRETADRWEVLRRDAARLGPGLFGLLLYVDGLLVGKGFPPISPWWIATLRSFFESGKRWLLLRVGRRGGKSSTLCRVAVVEAIFCERKLSPGDIGIWPIFSVDRGEAAGRIVTIKAILDALSIDYEESKEYGRQRIITTDASGNPIEFRVYPATIGAASGFTGIGGTCDEEAKWKDENTGANPSKEVLRAVRPALGTLKQSDGCLAAGLSRYQIHGYRCSSAFAEAGTHYKDVNLGSTRLHHVATIGEEFLPIAKAALYTVADYDDAEGDEESARAIREYADSLEADSPNIPTFIANPSQDPIEKRIDEPDTLVFLREYGSRSASLDAKSFFDHARIDAAARLVFGSGSGAMCFAAIDTGSRRNAFALAIVRRIEIEDGWRWVPVVLREWKPAPGAPLDLRMKVLPEAARLCRKHGCESWWTDAYANDQVEIVGDGFDIATVYVGTDPFVQSYGPVRDAIYRGEVSLTTSVEGAEEAARQLKLVRSQPGDGGRTKILIPEEEDMHGDLGVALVRALANAGCGEYHSEDASDIHSCPSRYAGVMQDRSID